MTLAEAVLGALVDHENDKPRSQQIALGPSELGGCREYLRNVLTGAPRQPNSEWPTAAVVGTLVGDHVESVLSQRMGALTQVPVTTTLPNGLVVSGHADIVLPEQNALADVKTKGELDSVRKEGASLENKVQVSIYVTGLVQAGVLSEGATASLLYIDRSGNEQIIHEVVLSWDDIQHHIQVVCDRLDDVLVAQEHIDAGEVEWARALRDKTPPFCYSPKVMCPFRDLCWKGSEWYPDEQIVDKDVIATVERFIIARSQQNAVTRERQTHRESLRGVEGHVVSETGVYSVHWEGSALYVTRVKQ